MTIAPPTDLTVFALKPEDVRPAQEALAAWVAGKLAHLRSVVDQQGRDYDAASRLPFSDQASSWRRELDRTAREVAYYERLAAALEAGYLVVPDFPMTVFAIRTDRRQPSGVREQSYPPHFEQRPRALAAGEGRYVGLEATAELVDEREETERDGSKRKVKVWQADQFRDVAIPTRLVRPEILDATRRALALRIFDEVGMVGAPKRDPIIAGRIRHPAWKSYAPRGVTFFVA